MSVLTSRFFIFLFSVLFGFGSILAIYFKFFIEDDNGDLKYAGEDDNVISIIQDVGIKILHVIVGTIDLPLIGEIDLFGDITVETPPWYELPLALLLSILQLVALINVPLVTTIALAIYGGVYTYIKYLFLSLYIPNLARNNPMFSNIIIAIYSISNVTLAVLIFFVKNFLYLGVFILLLIEFVLLILGGFFDIVAACNRGNAIGSRNGYSKGDYL